MRPTPHSASAQFYRERDHIAAHSGGRIRDAEDDRLPLHIAGPIIIALSLSLWGGIGYIISSLL